MESILNLELNEGQAALIQEALTRQISHYRVELRNPPGDKDFNDEDYLYLATALVQMKDLIEAIDNFINNTPSSDPI